MRLDRIFSEGWKELGIEDPTPKPKIQFISTPIRINIIETGSIKDKMLDALKSEKDPADWWKDEETEQLSTSSPASYRIYFKAIVKTPCRVFNPKLNEWDDAMFVYTFLPGDGIVDVEGVDPLIKSQLQQGLNDSALWQAGYHLQEFLKPKWRGLVELTFGFDKHYLGDFPRIKEAWETFTNNTSSPRASQYLRMAHKLKERELTKYVGRNIIGGKVDNAVFTVYVE